MSHGLTVKPLNSLTTKFGCVLADPPWPEIGGGKIKRGADRHYPVMSVAEIARLPVRDIILPNSHLYMWVTNNYVPDALATVLPAWGFEKYITFLTWRKEGRIGLGQYFRGTTEHVIFARHGCPPYKSTPEGKRAQGITDFLTTIEEGGWWNEPRPGMVHSRKPTKIHEWAELVSHGPYLEMFARTARPGWEAWGNEAPESLTLEDILG